MRWGAFSLIIGLALPAWAEAGQLLALEASTVRSPRPADRSRATATGDGPARPGAGVPDLPAFADLGRDAEFLAPSIELPRVNRAESLADRPLFDRSADDPIAGFLAPASPGSGVAASSLARAARPSNDGLGRASSGSPVGPGGPDGLDGPVEPGGRQEGRITLDYATTSVGVASLTLATLGLFWWRLERDAR